ncbi:MAG: hypothetical protein LBQ20_02140 [Rhodanobacter sp.]|nr:hypothetical protein [Rhodanobacter sp.]
MQPQPLQPPHAIGIATALMCALASGALWCLLSLYSHYDLAGFAFAVAVLEVWVLRAHGYGGRWSGIVLATLCVMLASGSAYYLQAVARVASMLGLPIRTTLLQMGPRMTIDIARARLDGWTIATIACAIALSIVLMLRKDMRPA